MARSPIWFFTAAKVPSQAVVESQINTTVATFPELILGTNETFALQFTDGTNTAPTFCNANTHTLAVAISTARADDTPPLIYTDDFTETALGWNGEIPLTDASLYNHVAADPCVSDAFPKSKLWLQATVIRNSDNQRVAYALTPVYIWARTMPDTFPANTKTPAKQFDEWAIEITANLAAAQIAASAASSSAITSSGAASSSSASAASASVSALAANANANAAALSLVAVQQLETQAEASATNASASASSASNAETNCATHAYNAALSEDSAAASAIIASANAVIAYSNAVIATAAQISASSNAVIATAAQVAASASAASASASANAAANYVSNVSIQFVAFPSYSNSTGAAGQMAISADGFAVYHAGTGWTFFTGYKI